MTDTTTGTNEAAGGLPAEGGAATTRGARRRAALLEAATALFLERGYAGTSIDDVIARAGGSRRVVYEAFGNKQGLFAAAVLSLLDRALAPLDRLEAETGPPEAVLTRAGEAFVGVLTTPEILAAFRVVLGELHHMPGLGRTLFERGPERAYAAVGRYLRAQVAAGTLALEDPDAAARGLLEMMKGDVHLRGMLMPDEVPDEVAVRRHVAAAVAIFLEGARAR